MANDDDYVYDEIDAFLDKELGLEPYHPTPSNSAKADEMPSESATTKQQYENEINALEERLKQLKALKSQENKNNNHSNVDVQTAGGNTNVVVNVPQNNDTKTQFNLICETCGSTDIRMVNGSLGVCGHCGAKVAIKQPSENAPVKINIINATAKISAGNDSDSKITIETPYYVLPTKYTEEEFFRNMVVFLSAMRDTPVDILDSEFGKIQTRYPQFMLSEYHVEGSYSASVGYDRQEAYEDFEKEHDYINNQYVTKRVTKYRTVTDWHPHSGTIAKDEESKIKLGLSAGEGYMGETTPDTETETTFEVMFNPTILENEAEKFEDSNLNLELLTPSSTDESRAEYKAKDKAGNSIHLPGDRHKDVRTNFSTELLSRKFVIVPEYVLPFKKDGKEYQQNSFATWFVPIGMRGANIIQNKIEEKLGPVFSRGYLWEEDTSNKRYPSVQNERKNAVEQQTRKYAYSAILLSVLSMLLAIVFPFMAVASPNLGVLWILLGVAAMIFSIVGYLVYKKIRKQKEIQFTKLLLQEKMTRLEAYLKRNNMGPLYDEEKEFFEYKVG